MTCTRGTPARQAATAWRALETWPGATRGRAWSSSSTESWRARLPPMVRPSAVVMKTSLTALSAFATSRATASELTRQVRPSPSRPRGGTTGTMPFWSRVCRSSTSMRSTRPVWRWSTPLRMPRGWAITALVLAARRSAAERPSRISWVTRLAARRASSRVSASVTPEPSRSEGADVRSSARAWIWAEAPWTRTVRMLSDQSTATSIRMLPKLSSSTMAPSTATTKVFSRNWGT